MPMVSWDTERHVLRRAPDTPVASSTAAPNAIWQQLSFSPHRRASVGPVDDPHEREADRMAERAIGASHSAHSGTLDAPSAPTAGGNPLPSAVRAYFEPRFGRDFSAVRIHADDGAVAANAQLHAKAFTLGEHIWLGRGQSAATTSLMAHELAHVVQGSATEANAEATIRRKEDWDFTPSEYGALTKAKGALTFDSDSSWFPDAFRKNLKTTLDSLLDPKRKTAATGGVNTRDFYHGHVGIKDRLPPDVAKLRSTASSAGEAQYEKALGKSYADVTDANLPAYKKAVAASLPSATALLEAAAKLPDVVVIYHTFEGSMPSGMKVGSPGRNFITPLGGATAPFSPPDIDNASSWTDRFHNVYQFSFLVDEKGVIHVRPGSTTELSTVTGKPEK